MEYCTLPTLCNWIEQLCIVIFLDTAAKIYTEHFLFYFATAVFRHPTVAVGILFFSLDAYNVTTNNLIDLRFQYI